MKKFVSSLLTAVLLCTLLSVFAIPASALPLATTSGATIPSSDELIITDAELDTKDNSVLLRVYSEDPNISDYVSTMKITVKKGTEVIVRIMCADTPNGPWSILPDVGGKVTINEPGSIKVKLNGALSGYRFFKAEIEVSEPNFPASILSGGNVWIIAAVAAVVVIGAVSAVAIVKKKKKTALV